MTGRALVITRLSSVAMNIGTEAATMASQTGTDRARGGTAAGSEDGGSSGSERVVMSAPEA